MNRYLYYYFLSINFIAFAVSAADKAAAKLHKRRVPEKTLFTLAIFGGSAGLFISMIVCRHKTKHWYFMVGVPVIITLQVIIFVFLKNIL